MASRWIVRRGDKERGPFTSPQLKSLADSGQLRPTDLVSKQGEDRFVPAEKVKGLFGTKDNPAPKTAPAKPKAPAKSTGSAKPQADDDIFDFGAVEIIEDDDPVIVMDDSVDDFDVVALDSEVDEDDFDEPKPARSGRSGNSRREMRAARGRGNSPSRTAAAPTKPAKPKKAKKKRDDEEEDEEENGPWLNLVYGGACVLGGICFFIALGNEDPNTWQTRRNGAILAVVKMLYNFGGRWTVLGLAIAMSGLFFWSAFDQFRKAK